MNTNHHHSESSSGAACDAVAPLLPLVAQRLLEPDEAEAVRAHVAGCGSCRARLAVYDRLDNALRRHFEQIASSPIRVEEHMSRIHDEEQLDSIKEEIRSAPVLPPSAPIHAARRSPRRVFSWAAAIAAALVIALITTALLASHHLSPSVGKGPNNAQPAAPLSMYVSTPTNPTPGSVVASTYVLTALDAATGQARWRYDNGATPINVVALEAGVVYANSGDGHVYAFRASDGKRLWSFQALPYITYMKIVSGVVYAGSRDEKNLGLSAHAYTYALDAASGKQLWRFTSGGSVELVADGAVYVSAGYGATTTLYALNARDGSVRWTMQRDAEVWQAAGGMVYITQAIATPSDSQSVGALVALDAATGKQVWSFPGEGMLPLLLDHGVIYLAADDGQRAYPSPDLLYALDAHSGLERWHINVPGAIEPGLLLSNGVLFIPGIHAFDVNNGRQLWFTLLSNINILGVPAAVVDGVLYAFGNAFSPEWNIAALNASDGSLKWKRQIDGNNFIRVDTVINGVIYADLEAFGFPQPTTSHGVAYALRASDGSVLWSYDLGASGENASPLIG
jgi:outer membrane protein assembly factor BamB